MAFKSLSEERGPLSQGGNSILVDGQPIGYLRILQQDEFDELDYPVYEGESSIGRDEDCDLSIDAVSLSRKHAMFLVENGTHFVMDNSSRNKTFRKSVELRPNAFYELTNGCELTFADIKCQYFIGPSPNLDMADIGVTKETNCEPTQAYGIAECEEETDEAAEENPLPSLERESTMCLGNSDEEMQATQLYTAGTDEKEGETMEFEKTVAYNLDDNNSDADDGSCPSSPPLLPTRLLPRTPLANYRDDGKSAAESSKHASFGKDDSQSDEINKAEGRGGSASPIEEEVDPTLAYNLTTDSEEEGEAAGNVVEGDLESTVILSQQPSDSDQTDFEVGEEKDDTLLKGPTREDEILKKKANVIDGTVAYPSLEDAGGVAEDSDQTALEGEGRASCEVYDKEKDIFFDPPVPGPNIDGTRGEGLTSVEMYSTADAKSTSAQNMKHSFSLVPVIKGVGSRRGRGRRGTKMGGRVRGVRGKTSTQQEGVSVEELDCNAGPRTTNVAQVPFEQSNTLEEKEEGTAKVGGRQLATRNTRKKTPDEPPSVDTKKLPPSNPNSPELANLTTDTLEGTIPKVKPPKSSRPVRGKKGNNSSAELSSSPPPAVNLNILEEEKVEGTGKVGSKRLPKKRTRKEIQDDTKKLPLINPSSPECVDTSDGPIPSFKSQRLARQVQRKKNVDALSELSSDPAPAAINLDTVEEKEEEEVVEGNAKVGSRPLPTKKTHMKILDEPPSVEITKLPLSNSNSPELVNLTTDTLEGTIPKVKPSKPSRQLRRKKGNNSSPLLSSSPSPAQATTLADKDNKKSKTSKNTDRLEESLDIHPTDATLLLGDGDDSQSTALVGHGSLDQHGHERVRSDNAIAEGDGDKSASESAVGSKDAKRGRGRGVRQDVGGRAAAANVTGKSPAMSSHLKASPRNSVTRHHYASPKSDSTSSLSLSSFSSPASSQTQPCVMFTGVVDLEGERIVKALGGRLVDSVYQCTHLITDKIRRTVKFLCCLSRGCLIVSSNWLAACGKAGRFLPAGSYMVKDKASEKLHDFSLVKAHKSAKHHKLLSGYEVYLTPNLKPDRTQMSDIIMCSGGEPSNFLSPLPERPNNLVISCTEDLGMCSERLEAGKLVHSAELILGGVLRQELDLNSNLLTQPICSATDGAAGGGNGRKRREREVVPTLASKRRRK